MENLYHKKWEAKAGRSLAFRLAYGCDLLSSLQSIVEENDVRFGWLHFLGSVQKAKVGYYLQDRREFVSLSLEEPLEILSGVGNVSLREGKPFVHVHVTLMDRQGRAYGGHLMEGTVAYAVELFVHELVLPAPPERVFDEVTGLFLWV